MEIELRIDKEEFESLKKRANQEAIDDDPNNEESMKELLFRNGNISNPEIEVGRDEDIMTLFGEWYCFGRKIGFAYMKIPLSPDLAIQVVDRYMKKLGKLKTVLEATKD